MKRIIFLIVLAFFLIGCGSQKPTMTKETTVKDSISTVTRIVPRDTIVRVPSDSVRLQIPLYVLTEKPVQVVSESGKISAKVSRVEDEIIINCDLEALEMQLELLDKEIETLKSRTTTEKERVEVPVKYIPWWAKYLSVIGAITLVIIVGRIALKFIKPF